MRKLASLLLAISFTVLTLQPSRAKEISIGLDSAAQFNAAQILSAPKPEIPPDCHENCFKSCCIARFIIKPDGTTSVQLMSSSGSEEIDNETMETLKQWKFRPATLNGEPVESTKRVKVEFEVD